MNSDNLIDAGMVSKDAPIENRRRFLAGMATSAAAMTILGGCARAAENPPFGKSKSAPIASAGVRPLTGVTGKGARWGDFGEFGIATRHETEFYPEWGDGFRPADQL